MLTAHSLRKAFGLNPLFNNITFSISGAERVGLIGPNGCGKTTLLRILAGCETADAGHVSLHPVTLRRGYLPQGFAHEPQQTMIDVLNQTVGHPDHLEVELARLGTALGAAPDQPSLQQAYNQTLDRLSHCDVGRTHSTLAAFGLDAIPEDQPVGKLSGGQKTRLALACTLLADPDLLLLDEPTNHLDIAMLEWLEAWLQDFPGGVLIVSHDRTFLDRTVSRILDLDPSARSITEYVGNYSAYLDQITAARAKQWAAYHDQVAEIRRMEKDIARTRQQAQQREHKFRSKRTGGELAGLKGYKPYALAIAKRVARKAKSREKKLSRYLGAAARVEKPARSWQLKLSLEAAHLGRDVLFLENLAVGYTADKLLITGMTTSIRSGQRIVLTGANGIGKTTMLRTLAGLLPPLHGRFTLGQTVRMGYLSQEQEDIDPSQTPLETVLQAAPFDHTEARSFLHYFLFSGDDPLRANHTLSHGERARLALARLVAGGCNFLLLDEPINHLDIPSREQFEQALSQFTGTVLAVVHDRYFVERFATDLWWIEDRRLCTQILHSPEG